MLLGTFRGRLNVWDIAIEAESGPAETGVGGILSAVSVKFNPEDKKNRGMWAIRSHPAESQVFTLFVLLPESSPF